ncbi:MAG: carbohydrate ABC transporter permease [Clostridiaceae bacterium]|nr:carbohydrate ABC transporter permease [Clostridiaceae bacterium]
MAKNNLNQIPGATTHKSNRIGGVSELASKIFGEFILVVFSLLIWIPIYYFVIGAFKERGDIVKYPLLLTPELFTLDNFGAAIDKMNFFAALKNTGTITIVTLVIVVAFGSLAGFALSRIDHKAFRIYFAVIIALMVVPFIGVIIALIKQTVSMKIYNSLWANILIQAAWNLPFSIFLYTGFMRALPKELEEAAYVDGCSMFRVYFNIFLPLLAPVTATCLIRTGIGVWNDFLLSLTVLNDSYTPTLMVAVQSFFGERTSEYGLAFTGILLASIPIMILFIFLQKYFIKGIAAGAVKG